MANTKQFKTRDSATAFMRRHGVAKEFYVNFISTDVVGGKPVFIVDVDDMETFLDLQKLDEQTGGNAAAGNYSREDSDGRIIHPDYYNEDGEVKQNEVEVTDEEPEKETKQKKESKKKTSELAETKLGKRLREREEERSIDVKSERRRRVSMKEVKSDKLTKNQAKNVARQRTHSKENIPPTVGILKQFPDLPQNSIRAMCFYLILEGLDDDKVYGAMKEVFGEEKSSGKSRYPKIYRKELVRAKQLDENGKRIK